MPTLISTHEKLKWPRSDGDPSRWPARELSGIAGWFERCTPGDTKYTLYEEKVGQMLAEHLGIPGNGTTHRISLPEGYALYSHNKPQSEGSIRTDVYLYGSTHVTKFRSPAEFFEHAQWLFDTSRPLSDHTRCECRYNSTSTIAQAKRQKNAGGSPAMKRVSGADGSGSRKRAKEDDGSEDMDQTAVVPLERTTDLQTGRRFRKGELVWMRISTITPPIDHPKKGLPSLTHWPALIADIRTATKTITEGATDVAWTSAMGPPPPGVQVKTVVKHIIEHHLRPLGLFAQADEVVKISKDLLPWQLGNELLGGAEGWLALGEEGTRIIKESVEKETKADGKTSHDLSLEERWRAKWGKRWRFLELPQEWELQVFRIGVALKTAHAITNSWTQTDRIEADVIFGAEVNPEDARKIMSQEKTLYQGLWWGGERIWCDDMVRLKKNRSELPVGPLKAPSPGSEDRAVLLKVRVITVEITPSTDKETSFLCLCYGDLFEVADASSEKPTTQSQPQQSSPLPSDKPPKGYEYRQLNDPGFEVTCDVIDIAGRLYSDLLDAKTQTFFLDPDSPELKKGRTAHGDSVKALLGLKPGMTTASKSEHWMEDLYGIVSEANRKTENDLKTFYGKLLMERGIRFPIRKPSNGTEVINTVTNGAPSTLAEAIGVK
ncbi:hypothetical protein M231_00114 [Tremella mesenterica]|uniref:Cryptic loci regulator 2 N-terminal domain-containing protein n=1 Tax=Tremella mesenterica TaxID=5217 RepID=A0A4Q1BWN2_TREME|nr:hypothetical protein M231_00114 [Tremella mesenterica]